MGNRWERNRRPHGIEESDVPLLLELPLFAGLAPDELLALLADARVAVAPAASLLFLQGDPARHFYVVLKGWVKLFRTTAEGDEAIIAVIPEGQSFAEAAVFEEGSYPVSAAMVDDSRLLCIPAEPFLEKVINDRHMVMKMMASMSRRLRQLVNQVEDLSLKSSVERVAGYLAGLCAEETGAAIVRLPLDKAVIARHLGMQPETLSRSFARLRSQGVVAEGNTVQISDVADLRRLSRQEGDSRSSVA
jgi:CRP/FNR family transcriptional regulator, dissimilatory nitrate respiration regulator